MAGSRREWIDEGIAMIDVAAWWLGIFMLSFVAVGMMLTAMIILYRAYLATLDLTCALVRVRRKRLPRHKWSCTSWQAWCHSFWKGHAGDIHAQAWKLICSSRTKNNP
jgi:hypothetical protein